MTVWVTTDRKQFVPRTVKLGLEQDGLVQIVDGIKPGEMVASEGALFLSSVAATASQ
jgi:cobalt-zinc-cadmium efflux system membrane fusion protein